MCQDFCYGRQDGFSQVCRLFLPVLDILLYYPPECRHSSCFEVGGENAVELSALCRRDKVFAVPLNISEFYDFTHDFIAGCIRSYGTVQGVIVLIFFEEQLFDIWVIHVPCDACHIFNQRCFRIPRLGFRFFFIYAAVKNGAGVVACWEVAQRGLFIVIVIVVSLSKQGKIAWALYNGRRCSKCAAVRERHCHHRALLLCIRKELRDISVSDCRIHLPLLLCEGGKVYLLARRDDCEVRCYFGIIEALGLYLEVNPRNCFSEIGDGCRNGFRRFLKMRFGQVLTVASVICDRFMFFSE